MSFVLLCLSVATLLLALLLGGCLLSVFALAEKVQVLERRLQSHTEILTRLHERSLQ